MNTLQLASGGSLPQLGLGTWRLTGGDCETAVRKALDMGYRHIDTAEMYGNHREVAAGMAASGVDRSEIFLTTKVWSSNLRHNEVFESFDQDLVELETDYVDLLLIHWPNSSVPLAETLGAFEELVDGGKVRNIGVSNFTSSLVEKAADTAKHPLVTNQVECHPFLNQSKLLTTCRRHDVTLTAYSPLARGRVLDDETLSTIAKNHDKSPVQVALKWQIQRGIVVIPKASSEEHLRSNMDIFDWSLSDDEMDAITGIEKTQHTRIIESGAVDFSEDE
jgi:diketogulonate reductase-like aldo/keto reductase